jgi:hypothetical protein
LTEQEDGAGLLGSEEAGGGEGEAWWVKMKVKVKMQIKAGPVDSALS